MNTNIQTEKSISHENNLNLYNTAQRDLDELLFLFIDVIVKYKRIDGAQLPD